MPNARKTGPAASPTGKAKKTATAEAKAKTEADSRQKAKDQAEVQAKAAAEAKQAADRDAALLNAAKADEAQANAQKAGDAQAAAEAQAAANKTAPVVVPTAVAHTVAAGDTLIKISQQYYRTGTRWMDIYDANKAAIGDNPDRIQVGQVLVIPGVAAA